MKVVLCFIALFALQAFGDKEQIINLEQVGTANQPTLLSEYIGEGEKLILRLEYIEGTGYEWMVDYQTNDISVSSGGFQANNNLYGGSGYQIWYISCQKVDCKNQKNNFIYVRSWEYEKGQYNGDETYLRVEINNDKEESGLLLSLCFLLLSFLFFI